MKFTEKDAVDLSRFLTGRKVLRNRVYRVGIELEGAWDRQKMPEGAGIQRDSSVQFPSMTPEETGYLMVGEVPSPTREVVKGSNTDFRVWMKTYYPHKVNDTCGMHIHMSFKNALTYQRTMTKKYPASIVAYVREWAEKENLPKASPIWRRLDGKSSYCRHLFIADDQVLNIHKDYDRERKGNRYTSIHYCFSRQQTVECRLLPMMDEVDQAIRAVERVVDITNAFLLATAAKERPVPILFNGDGDEQIVEERRVWA